MAGSANNPPRRRIPLMPNGDPSLPTLGFPLPDQGQIFNVGLEAPSVGYSSSGSSAPAPSGLYPDFDTELERRVEQILTQETQFLRGTIATQQMRLDSQDAMIQKLHGVLDHVMTQMHIPPPAGDTADDANEDANHEEMQPPYDTIN